MNEDGEKRILVVDDENIITMHMEELLEGAGYVVECASNGKEAVEKVRTFDPDVTLMDMVMPLGDGISAIKVIKSEGLVTNIIVVTALSQKSLLMEALESGAVDYILKPFQPNDLLSMIKRYLE